MSNSLMQPDLQLDTTLTKEGYAADAKITGDRLDSKQNKIVLKSMAVSGTSDQYAQFYTTIPSDAIAIIGIVNTAFVFIPMSLSLSFPSWRCMKGLSILELSFAKNTEVTGTLWYLAVEST